MRRLAYRGRMELAIRSERLDLVPMSPGFLDASLEGDRALAAERLGVPLPDAWPDDRGILELRLRELREDPSLQPWLLRALVLRAGPHFAGHIGFHTAPAPAYLEAFAPGGVELGYTVFAPFRRRGLAREACLALMVWARSVHGVPRFVVSISPDNAASRALALGLGFRRVGSHADAVDGFEDVYALEAASLGT